MPCASTRHGAAVVQSSHLLVASVFCPPYRRGAAISPGARGDVPADSHGRTPRSAPRLPRARSAQAVASGAAPAGSAVARLDRAVSAAGRAAPANSPRVGTASLPAARRAVASPQPFPAASSPRPLVWPLPVPWSVVREPKGVVHIAVG